MLDVTSNYVGMRSNHWYNASANYVFITKIKQNILK